MPNTSCIALGVTGSIAAYKAADLTSKLVQAGHDVHVLMTGSACELVQPQTFLTLSRNPVTTQLWNLPTWQPEHIALADKAEILVVAPATANFIGKLANGIADDALSTYALSHTGPVLVAPAMNPRMWQHPAVQANVKTLKARGVVFVEPAEGRVACGEAGTGRLADVPEIQRAIEVQLACRSLKKSKQSPKRIVITAGPTREAIDPVRFLSNRSSGKMGYAIAEVAAAAGHDTVLISGPVALPPPAGCRTIDVTSAAEMAAAVKAEFAEADLLIMAAAVADYRPADCASDKIKKGEGNLTLELVRTEDILRSLADLKKPGQAILGFAAETRDLETNAIAKLKAKKLDWIAANDVGRADIGFESDRNEITLFATDGTATPLGRHSKLQLAAKLLEAVAARKNR